MKPNVFANSRNLAAGLFGIVFPVVILIQAYIGLASLGASIRHERSLDDNIKMFTAAKHALNSANDYKLFSLFYSEQANEETMINKQVMKVAVMQIGFAVSSMGIMFVILGFNDGGAAVVGELSGVKYDFKTGSTGIVVFLVGAIMATVSGVLKNDYTTVPIPDFGYESANPKYVASLNAYEQCKERGGNEFQNCFASLFQQINEGALK